MICHRFEEMVEDGYIVEDDGVGGVVFVVSLILLFLLVLNSTTLKSRRYRD